MVFKYNLRSSVGRKWKQMKDNKDRNDEGRLEEGVCNGCKVKVEDVNKTLECSACKATFHGPCTQVPLLDKDVKMLNELLVVNPCVCWICPKCCTSKVLGIESSIEETVSVAQNAAVEAITQMTAEIQSSLTEKMETIISTKLEEMVNKKMEGIMNPKMEEIKSSLCTEVTTPLNNVKTSVNKIKLDVQKNLTYHTNEIKKQSTILKAKQTPGVEKFKVANGRGKAVAYDAKKTVIIKGVKDKELVSSSQKIKSTLSKYFTAIPIEYAYLNKKGTVQFQFKTEDKAKEVIAAWQPEYFGGGTSVYSPATEKTYAVLRDVDKDIPDEEIKEILEKNYGTVECRRITYGERPSFVVKVKFSTEADMKMAIEKGIIIGNVKIYPEESYSRKVRTFRCFNCQKFGHIQTFCKNSPACDNCSGKHQTRDCTTPDAKKCANCELNHKASSPDCPKFKAIQESRANSLYESLNSPRYG